MLPQTLDLTDIIFDVRNTLYKSDPLARSQWRWQRSRTNQIDIWAEYSVRGAVAQGPLDAQPKSMRSLRAKSQCRITSTATAWILQRLPKLCGWQKPDTTWGFLSLLILPSNLYKSCCVAQVVSHGACQTALKSYTERFLWQNSTTDWIETFKSWAGRE